MASTAPSGDGGYVSNYTPSYYDNAAKFNPTTAVVIIVLIAGCFVLAFLFVVVRRCIRGDPTFPQSSLSPQSGSYNTKTRGLEKAVVDALPLVRCTDLGEKDDHECPVCLTEFEPEETLRLLPSCKHVFHQECIDAWFDSHSTCPLCRASLVGGDAEKNSTPGVEQVGPGVSVASIYDASEIEDSDVEVHGGVMHGARRNVPLEDSRTATGVSQLSARISREDERSSARGTLFRNSESFKRAARGVEAYESAAAAAESEKDLSFRKPPLASASIRQSSSLGADLISLRNLLMGADQNADASSGSSRWFTRTKSLELASRDRAVQNECSREPSRDVWVTIDLETGKATSEAEPSASSKGESSKGPASERSWSDRFSLSSLKSLKGIAILSRSTSDVSSRHTADLPIRGD